MTPHELAEAFGGQLDTEGRVVIPLADGELYPLGNILGFIHDELTRPDLLLARVVAAVGRLAPAPIPYPLPAPVPTPIPAPIPAPIPTPAGSPIDAEFTCRYPAGTATQHVTLTGNDTNAGTAAAPKRTVLAAARALTAGGTVYVGDGNHGTLNLSGINGTANRWVIIRAVNPLRAQFTTIWNSAAVRIKDCSYVALHGFEVVGKDGPTYTDAGCVVISSAHHVAVWRCWTHHGTVGVGAVGNAGPINNLDICYNVVNDCAKWSPWASSGISVYNLWDSSRCGAADGPDGYSNHVVGNICSNNFESTGPMSDGNGIIIDDANNTQSYGGPAGLVYTGHTLVLGNVTVHNGGRGVHAAWSNNVHQMFNTSAHNNFNKPTSRFGEIMQMFSLAGGRVVGNLCAVDTVSGRSDWLDEYANKGLVVDSNTRDFVWGSFATKPPELALLNAGNVGTWRPASDLKRVTVPADVLAALRVWPTLLDAYRPVSGVWYPGALEA